MVPVPKHWYNNIWYNGHNDYELIYEFFCLDLCTFVLIYMSNIVCVLCGHGLMSTVVRTGPGNISVVNLNFQIGGSTGLVVRAWGSGSGDPGSILGRVGVLFP